MVESVANASTIYNKEYIYIYIFDGRKPERPSFKMFEIRCTIIFKGSSIFLFIELSCIFILSAIFYFIGSKNDLLHYISKYTWEIS